MSSGDKIMRAKYGIVVMLDALGAREQIKFDSVVFLNSVSAFLKEIKPLMANPRHRAKTITQVNERLKAQNKGTVKNNIRHTQPEITTFQDTIMLTWESPSSEVSLRLNLLCTFLQAAIWVGLKNGLRLRGAISIGDYIHNKAKWAILGPAVADAASWYEEAQWIGIICTPSCGFRLAGDLDLEKNDIDYFSYYPVPIAGDKTLDLWCVSWPLFAHNTYHLSPKTLDSSEYNNKYLFGYLASFDVPKSTENKYFNTINFFEWCKQKYKNNEGFRPFEN